MKRVNNKSSKAKNSPARPLIPTFKIFVEGGKKKNETEKRYFRYIHRTQSSSCYLDFGSCGDTHLEGLYRQAKSFIKERNSISKDKKDHIDQAFIVFDLDVDSNKWKAKIDFAIAHTSDQIHFIPSNPMFEYWLILHHQQCQPAFNTSNEVISCLTKLKPKYKKNVIPEYTGIQLKRAVKYAKGYLDPKNNKSELELLRMAEKRTNTMVYWLIENLISDKNY